MPFDAARHDRLFTEYQHLDRARQEAYERVVERCGGGLMELSALASRWRALAEFWRRVRDEDTTAFLLREAATTAAIHADERAQWCAHQAVHQPDRAE